MSTSKIRPGWFLLVGLLISACSTPQSRIEKNPELFASYPPEIQEIIKRGQVVLAFTPDMVTMALGKPNRTYTRQTQAGVFEVWSYTGKRIYTESQRVRADFRYRDSSGRYQRDNDWVWVDVNREVEFERIRVEFSNGVVSAIEQLEP